MGSGGKGGETDWNEVAYGQSNKHFAGGGNRDTLSAADPNYAPGGKYAAAADYAWGQNQQAATQEQQMMDFVTNMTQMSQSQPFVQPAPDLEEEARLDWRDEGRFQENASFADMSKQLGPLKDGQSYLWDATGGDTPYWTVEDTPDFGNDAHGPGQHGEGYTGLGYTAGGVSFKEGRGLRDVAMEKYTSALGQAESFVDSQIAQERTNNRLMGVTYEATDEARSNRIGQALGDYGWGESQQTDFTELLDTWGAAGYEQTATPIAGGVSSTPGQTDTGPAATGSTPAASTIITEDEDTLGQTSALGG